jgi:hypothetical protein
MMPQEGDKQKIYPTKEEIRQGWKELKQDIKKEWKDLKK